MNTGVCIGELDAGEDGLNRCPEVWAVKEVGFAADEGVLDRLQRRVVFLDAVPQLLDLRTASERQATGERFRQSMRRFVSASVKPTS